MRTRVTAVLLMSGALCLVGLLASVSGVHGAGIDYKVTIRNDTNMVVHVEVWCVGLGDKLGAYKIIPANSTVIAETGALCPKYLTGKIFMPQSDDSRNLSTICASGANARESTSGCKAVCWDTSWKICRLIGAPGDYVKPRDYGFCKQ